MQISIHEQLRPFSHRPGCVFNLLKTSYSVRIYPCLLVFKEVQKNKTIEIELDIAGPVIDFTVLQDLKKNIIYVYGHSKNGYFQYQILSQNERISLFFKKIPKDKLVLKVDNSKVTIKKEDQLTLDIKTYPIKESNERLSLGITKKQDFDKINNREDLLELLPYLIAISKQTINAKKTTEGTASVLNPLEKMIKNNEKDQLEDAIFAFLKASFFDVLAPRLIDDDYQGIVKKTAISKASNSLYLIQKGSSLVRSLFFTEVKNIFNILPCLLKSFHHGRFINIQTSFGLLDIEWSKKLIKKMILRSSVSKTLKLNLQSAIKSFRFKVSKKDRGTILAFNDEMHIEKDTIYYFDRFQK